MSGVKWVKGDPKRMIAAIEAFGRDAATAAVESLQEVTDQAERDIKHIIETSTTPTGERRSAAGKGVAGRIESEEMHKNVKGRTTRSGDKVTGRFGWLEDASDKALRHASYQDPGTDRIQGMNAIFQSFVVATNDLKRKLTERGFKIQ